MNGLEDFLRRFLGPRQPGFGVSEDAMRSIEMPAPLHRFFRFAGRWPGQNPESPYQNRFCVQDQLASLTSNGYAPALEVVDDRLVFLWENQGVWVAATEPSGADPPVWVTENCSHRETRRVWRQLEKPLSHFLVSFVLQELVFGSELLAAAPQALAKFEEAELSVEAVWKRGEYAWDSDWPSYFLAADRILVRRSPDEGDGDDWYGCNDAACADVFASLGLPIRIG